MSKSAKRQTQTIDRRHTDRHRTVKSPVPARPRAKTVTPGRRQSCFDCVFCLSNALLWLRTLATGFPVGGQCANHPDTPGQVRPIAGAPCRNFRGKPYRVEPPQPPNDKIRYIPLTRGLHAIVDADDYEWLSQYKWQAHRTSCGGMYAVHATSRGQVFMHRMLMNPPDGMVVDHINGNGLDNRRCNLRVCTPRENSRNRRKHRDGKSRFIGVSPCGKKWQVFVGHRYLGVFNDEVEAAKARDHEATEQYGDHAWLNFPPQGGDSDN